ncbi:Nucleic acid-binding, OB-fold [Sesbania bispinosa]|nr:Nucleic acid-binding, OB-fold [Sesbania bispinosa]
MAMVSTGYHAVKTICGRRQSWRLKVKLVRIWNMCALATPEDPFATEMVLVDEEGETIEGTILKQNMRRFANLMAEGQVYKITNFGVVTSKGNFRASRHDYKIMFNANTKITAVAAAVNPHLGLNLLMRLLILICRLHGNCMSLNKQGRATRLMLIDMVDEMGTIRFAAFGQLIDAIRGFLVTSGIGLPVVIIQLGRVNLYKAEVGIQNVHNATKIWWNPEIPDAVDFKNSLAVHEIETDVAISLISDRKRPMSKRDEFLSCYPRKSIGQLHELIEDGFFIILGTIKEIVDDGLWWYMACSCMKAVNYGRGYPYCDDCHRAYKVKILVSDGEDCAHLLMWDSECYSLLKKSCREMLSDLKGGESGPYPDDMLSWVDKEMLFRIERKGESTFGYDESFPVRRICFDTSLISEFKDIANDETPLKLKFAPPFTKVPPIEGTSSVIDVSPQSICSASPLDVSPISIENPASSAAECSILSKRSGGPTPDEDVDKTRLPRKKHPRAPVADWNKFAFLLLSCFPEILEVVEDSLQFLLLSRPLLP